MTAESDATLSREDVERILALAIQIRERAMECDRVRFEMRHNTVFVLREAIRDVSNFAIEKCEAALRYLSIRDGTRIACYVDGVRISGPALDAEVDK